LVTTEEDEELPFELQTRLPLALVGASFLCSRGDAEGDEERTALWRGGAGSCSSQREAAIAGVSVPHSLCILRFLPPWRWSQGTKKKKWRRKLGQVEKDWTMHREPRGRDAGSW
jgi:hypothetical protein